jgi:hypothetical protein
MARNTPHQGIQLEHFIPTLEKIFHKIFETQNADLFSMRYPRA